MKRFASLFLCMFFLFSLSACKNPGIDSSSSSSGTDEETLESSRTDNDNAHESAAESNAESSSIPTATEIPQDPLPGAPELDSSNGHLTRFTETEDFETFTLNAVESEDSETGAIQLSQADSGYQPLGNCISPVINADEFSELTVSWNATLPLSTSVEVEARVKILQDEEGREIWSDWFSWGEYAPGVERISQKKSDGAASICADVLTTEEYSAVAFQIRATLRTNDVSLTPTLRSIFVSTRNSKLASPMANSEVEDDVNWLVTLETPSISFNQCYEPFASKMSVPCSMAMLMQQKGEDILPEILALSSRDDYSDSFSNLSYASALAGAFGYEAYTGYTDVAGLKREIAAGYPVAIMLSYAGDDVEDSELPHIDGASGERNQHMVVLRGFTARNGQLYAVVNDPAAESAGKVRRTYSMEQLAAAWDGRACFLHNREVNVDAPIEERTLELRSEEDGYRLYNPQSNVLFSYNERAIFAVMTNGQLSSFEYPVHNKFFLLQDTKEERELWVITDLGILYRASIPQ